MVAAARAVLGVCMCLWLAVGQSRASHIPQKMNRTIQNLLQLQRYKITNSQRFNQEPVFSKEPLSAQMEAKVVFMAGVLEMYEQLIEHMLKQLPTPSPQITGSNQPPASADTPATAAGEVGAGKDVRAELEYLLGKVSDLKKKRYQDQGKFLGQLSDLGKIQMNDVVVQSKALGELPWLYEEASMLFEEIKLEKKRRRRRQARRVKTHPRA